MSDSIFTSATVSAYHADQPFSVDGFNTMQANLLNIGSPAAYNAQNAGTPQVEIGSRIK